MDVVTALERSYHQTAKLVTDLDGAQLDAPSPCAGWDVRSTLNHLLGATWMFTLVNQGRPAGEDAGDVIGDDPSLAVAAAVKENLASWRQPEAFEGERAYPFGTFPAPFAALLNLEEVVVHNWDIATATGTDLEVDEDVAQLVYAWATSIPLDEFRAHGAFGPEVAVAASATTVDRVLALLGRDPETQNRGERS
jgi:uncharacterized protein (TIGR03086 family)